MKKVLKHSILSSKKADNGRKSMNQQKIGKFICDLRKEKNLSQYQLADMIPISRQAVSKWERGITIPDSLVLIKLSEIFDVSINEILAGERIEKKSIKKN